MERPPDQHGDDPGHPDVHGPGVRTAEQLRERVQPRPSHLQGQGRQVRIQSLKGLIFGSQLLFLLFQC